MFKKILSILLLACMLTSFAAAEEIETTETNYTRIDKGAYSDEVKAVQERLLELGYLTGTVDGSYWTRTQRAIMRFEQQNYLVVTPDYIDEATLEYLFSDQTEQANTIVCKLGEKNEAVSLMQEMLYKWGFFQGRIDGTYGSGTAEAVAEFQDTIWSRDWAERHADDGLDYTESNFTLDGNSVDSYIFQYFLDDSYTIYYTDLSLGSKGPDVGRIQNILYNYNYLWREPDDNYDYFTQAAVIAFQKAHGLPVTGIADEATQKRMMDEDIIMCEKIAKPYRLVVDVDQQKVFAYAWDGESYSSLVRAMVCSTGTIDTPTPVGIYTDTYPLNVWHHFLFYHCFAQYSYVIEGGVMFHSVLYYERTDSDGNVTHGGVDQPSVDNLGTRQSHGCVRLSVEDAKWIYVNCPRGTEVEVMQLTPDPKTAE